MSRTTVPSGLTADGVQVDGVQVDRVQIDGVQVDVSSLRPLFHEPAPAVDLSRAVLPGHPDDPTPALARSAAKLYLKRLLVQLRDQGNACGSPGARRSAQALVDGLLRLPHEELLRTVLRPEVTSWTRVAQQVQRGERQVSPDLLVAYAGSFLLPGLLSPGVLAEAGILAVAEEGELPLMPLGRALRLPVAAGALLTVRVDGASLRVSAGERAEAVAVVPLEALSGAAGKAGKAGKAGEAAGHPGVRELPSLFGGLVVTGPQSWHTIAYPPAASRPLELSARELDDFTSALGTGLATVDAHWPEAAAVVRRTAKQVMPVVSQGNWPFNFTIPEFRGLVLTSGRHTYLSAQTLVHECGHNRFNTVLDLYSVAENAAEEQYSPFVEVPRPLVNIFHGVFAFLNDVHMAIRCQEVFGPADGPAIAPYVKDITERLTVGLETLERHARVTEQGAQLLTAFRAAMPG